MHEPAPRAIRNLNPKSSDGDSIRPSDQNIALMAALSEHSFTRPSYSPVSDWAGHEPFAFWLIDALRPRKFAELGTLSGLSYFTVCQAVLTLGLDTKCYAIDPRKGDGHAETLEETSFQNVENHNEKHYSTFSKLVRSSFENAASYFEDGSIDLLHIDHRPGYEDVKNDFEAWAPKLSDRSVALFHDTNVREPGFGVHRYWEELTKQYPSFEFVHARGLGVLAVGGALPDRIKYFIDSGKDADAADSIRKIYAGLGTFTRLQSESVKELSQVRSLAVEQERVARLERELDQALKNIDQKERELTSARREIANVHAAYRNSVSWKLTAPARALSALRPKLIRKSRSALSVLRRANPAASRILAQPQASGDNLVEHHNVGRAGQTRGTLSAPPKLKYYQRKTANVLTSEQEPYRYVMSVGHNCGAAYQIRLHTGLREAYFFDWLFSPIESVAKVISANFRDVFLRERLEITREGREVLDRHYGLRLNHSFKVDGVGLVVPELMERNLRAERDKFNFMAGKFLSALRSDERCAFIRYNPFPAKSEGAGSIDKLRSALMNQAGNPNTSLIVVENSHDAPRITTDGNLTMMKIREVPSRSRSYRGGDFILTDDVAWGEVFATLPVNLSGRRST